MTDARRCLRPLLGPPESDADLLGRFLTDRDEESFARLVRRHGPMVLAVCLRVLRHRQDAEDAFQATFLVLARRAGAVRPRSLLGNWLYGVAHRTALEARRAAATRRAKEHAAVRGAAVTPDGPEPDVREVLDRELAALPEAYRAAVVVCDLEGLGRREAAARLGWSEGTLSSRLARARTLLARRLARYGLAVPAGILGVAVPAGLAGSAARLGVLVAAGEAAVVAAPVAALTNGVLKAMLVTKLKGLTAAVMVGCAVLVTAAAGWQAEAAPQDRPAAKAADAPKRGGRDAEKDRIAELERERDLLLRLVADLRDRLTALEEVQRAERARADEARAAEARARRDAESLRDSLRKGPADTRGLVDPTRPGPAGAAPSTNPAPAVGLPPVPASGVPPTPVPLSGTPAGLPAPTQNLPPLDGPAGGTRPGWPPPSAPTSRPAFPPGHGAPPEPRPDTGPVRPTAPVGPVAYNAVVPPRGSGLVTKVYPVDELAVNDQQAEALIRLVRRAAGTGTWDGEGGPGVVEYFQQGKALVVKNTADAHKEVNELLDLLKGAAKKAGWPPRP